MGFYLVVCFWFVGGFLVWFGLVLFFFPLRLLFKVLNLLYKNCVKNISKLYSKCHGNISVTIKKIFKLP